MDRVLKDTTATIYGRFYVDGTGTDPSPDSATVTITRADGTVLVDDQNATNVAGTGNEGKFSYQLTTTHTELLDRLTVRWTSNLGTVETTVEVAGGFLFSIAQARAYSGLSDSAKVSTARLIEGRVMVEQALEQACGVAFVPRYERERLTGTQAWLTTDLQLKWPKLRAIRDATVGGTALDSAALGTVVPAGSFFYYPAGWTAWAAAYDITVGYEHGHGFAPARVAQAAILLAKRWLLAGPIDDRTTSMSTEDGTFMLATPGLRGSTFGIPEVDAVVSQYRMPVVV